MTRSTRLRTRVQGPSQPGPAGPGRSALSPHNSPRQRGPGEDVGSLPAGQAAFIHLPEVARISYGTQRSGSRAPRARCAPGRPSRELPDRPGRPHLHRPARRHLQRPRRPSRLPPSQRRRFRPGRSSITARPPPLRPPPPPPCRPCSTPASPRRRSPSGRATELASCSASTPSASPASTKTPSAASRPPPCQRTTTGDDDQAANVIRNLGTYWDSQPPTAALSRIQPHRTRTAPDHKTTGQGLYFQVVAGVGFEPT